MAFDICPPAGVPRPELEEAVRLTTHWALRQREEERAPGQLVFGIAQGAADPELRRRSIEEMRAQAAGGTDLDKAARELGAQANPPAVK